jgi:hypothetical protein
MLSSVVSLLVQQPQRFVEEEPHLRIPLRLLRRPALHGSLNPALRRTDGLPTGQRHRDADGA